MDLVIRADGGRNGGDEAGPRQLALGAVIVDVVGVEDRQFRGIARLAGAQDDARLGHAQLAADEADHLQAGILGFHHHVEQDDGEIAILFQQRPGFFGGLCMGQFERAPENVDVLQGEFSRQMHFAVVIDNQDAPRRLLWARCPDLAIFDENHQVVVVIHRLLPSANPQPVF